MRSQDCEDGYPTDEETALWVAINRAQQSVYRSMDSVLKTNKLPPLRWYDVLWSIERAGRSGIRPFEMERTLIFEQSNLSRLLRRMIDEGLIEETQDQNDKRGKIINITASGLMVRRKMWTVYGPLIHLHMREVCERYDADFVASVLTKLLNPEETSLN